MLSNLVIVHERPYNVLRWQARLSLFTARTYVTLVLNIVLCRRDSMIGDEEAFLAISESSLLKMTGTSSQKECLSS